MDTQVFRPSICVIGSGFSGICAAIQLKNKLGIDSFTIFDENEDVGGTWLKNTYLGCSADISGHLYSFSFEPNPNWSQNYPPRVEIWNYIKDVVKKHDIYKNIKFNTQVLDLRWIEDSQNWQVTICQKDQERTKQLLHFDIVINGSGSLRIPNYPPEFKSFKGEVIHSAEWNDNVSLENKAVAVVGSGSSAVQIIPEIAKVAKTVNVYQRSPAWVLPKPQFNYPKWMKFLFSVLPLLMWIPWGIAYVLMELAFLQSNKGSLMNFIGSAICSTHLDSVLGSTDVANDLKPNYPYACKRVCFSDNYYQAFRLSNVKLHRKAIVQFAADSIETNDGMEKADVLILATGFKATDYFAPMKMFGRKGEDILETWRNDSPSAYYGIMTKSAPNMFIILGPNSILTHNSVLLVVECQVNYIIKVIQKMISSGYKSVSVKPEFEDEYMTQLKERMSKKLWTKGCNSWYKTDKGDVTSIMPWSSLSYRWHTRNVDFHHLQFTPLIKVNSKRISKYQF